LINNHLLDVVFDDVVDFLSFDVPEGIAVPNIRARSFTDKAKKKKKNKQNQLKF